MNRQGFLWFLVFLSVWLMIAGTLHLESVIIGALVAFFVTLYTKDDRVFKTRGSVKTLRVWGRIFRLFLVDLVVSNWALAKVLLARKMPINPHMITLEQPLKDPLLQVLYANGVTLTPGTLTVLCEEQTLMVHCLTDEADHAIKNHPLRAAYRLLEGKNHD